MLCSVAEYDLEVLALPRAGVTSVRRHTCFVQLEMEPKALCVQGKHSTHRATPPASIFGIFTLFFLSLLTALSLVWSLQIGIFVPFLPVLPHITVVCRHVIVSLSWAWDPSSWSLSSG